MHILFILISLMALAAVIAWVVMDKPKEQIQDAINGVASGMKPHKPNHAEALKHWAQENLEDEAQLQSWLLALPDEGLQALGEKLHEFAHEMDMDLHWLQDPDGDNAAEAQQTNEPLVIDYCKLCMKAVHKS